MKLKTLIVDDSPNAQILLGEMVEDHPQLKLVTKVGNALEAKKYFKDGQIDLLFLTIEMPIINGFDLLSSLANPPLTILTTEKPDYAVMAFEYNIVYYLMKPITFSSFRKSIERVIARYMLTHTSRNDEEYVLVKSDSKKKKVFFDTIHWVEALGDYMRIVTDEGNVITLLSMKSLAEKLPDDRFLRIHKSYIVNLNKIDRFNSSMVEIENTPIPLSRNKRNELDKALAI